MTCVLASTSAIRRQLLIAAGVPLKVERPVVDERDLMRNNPAWSPIEAAQNIAGAKALAVSRIHQTSIVVGADQVLALGNDMLHKPASLTECRAQLLRLRGKEHRLITAACCARNGEILWSMSDTATLRMRNFTDSFLDGYLTAVGNEALESVGGYKLESLGVQLFDRISGDYFTILGLPLLAVLNFLREKGEIGA